MVTDYKQSYEVRVENGKAGMYIVYKISWTVGNESVFSRNPLA